MKKILLMLLCVSVLGCSKNSVESEKPVDVLLIGGGIMSATLGTYLNELEPGWTIEMVERLDKVAGQVQRDRVWSGELGELWAQYQARLAKHAQEGKRDAELQVYRWMLEEYRVSLFAQQLGTRLPVSDKRLAKQWSQVEG